MMSLSLIHPNDLPKDEEPDTNESIKEPGLGIYSGCQQLSPVRPKCKFCNKNSYKIYTYRKKIKIGEDGNRGIYRYQNGDKVYLCGTHFNFITCDYSYNKLIYSKNNKLCIPIGQTIYAKKIKF